MIQKFREFVRKNKTLREFFAFHVATTGIFDKAFINYKLSDNWNKRLVKVMECKDNNFIDRVPDSGKIINGKQIMHNGLKVYAGSYYGPEVSVMLYKNRGVHEPQEERVFGEILKLIPHNSLMIEMGSYWSFYSMWFNKEVEGASNYLIEPDLFNLKQGIRNFKLNNCKGDFTNAFISNKSAIVDNVKTYSVDDFVKEKNIKHINLLHSDIQGAEFDMLLGARECITKSMIDYIFISTHQDSIHENCLKFLVDNNFHIIANSDLDNTFSEDGLIVASAPHIPTKILINIDQAIHY